MSKLQTSIQKAIEKSRGQPIKSRPQQDASSAKEIAAEESGSGIFRVFRTAQPNFTVMEESKIVSELEDSSAISAYKLLRTRVLQRMRSNNWRTLIVSSANPGEGKSLTASNLAVSLSRDVNQSVMLIDLDLQRSSIAKYFGFDTDIKHGIGEYLQGQAEISDIIYNPTNLQRITIIPNRVPVADSSDLLSSPRMKELLAWIKQQSDRTIVLFDMPPVLACDDVLAICPEIDAVLLVVAQGQTDRASLSKAMGLLAEANLLGVVLNRSDEANGKNPYGYY